LGPRGNLNLVIGAKKRLDYTPPSTEFTCLEYVKIMKYWIAVVFLAVVSGAVSAAAGDTLVVYRQQVMKAAAGHLRAAGAIAVEGLDRPGAEAGEHVRALEALGRMIPALFPPGSGGGDSDAEPAVWSDRSGFERSAREFVAAAQTFGGVVRDGGDAAAAYYRTLEACKACHKSYRAR
jgi:cytochrome c556